ncbi:hypothetical protein J4464_02535 [Candidatus Woesearchaeota archaeon]|nr:hypothetical protein [Candidatus Woesearchaeota archaeon]
MKLFIIAILITLCVGAFVLIAESSAPKSSTFHTVNSSDVQEFIMAEPIPETVKIAECV